MKRKQLIGLNKPSPYLSLSDSGLSGFFGFSGLFSGSFQNQIILLGRSPHSVAFPLQDDKCPFNCCKIKLQ